jgi:cytochrome c oxidase subunit II
MRRVPTALLCSLLPGCAWRQGALQPKGPKAFEIIELGALFFWVSLVVLSLVVLAAVWAFARGAERAGAGNERLEPTLPNPEVEQRLTRAVAASTIVSLLLLAVLLVASIATGRNLAELAPPKPLRVKVTAHQWWWKIEYPGNAPEDQAVTANELHVPAGMPVELELSSADVIHSFWIPNLDGKHDLIPNHTIKTMLQADQPGAYAGRCAEFCGYQHAHMDLLLVAEPPSEFQAWLASQRQPAAEPQAPAEIRGREVVEHGPCALCHTVAGTKALGGVGPDLSHFASRRTLGAGAAAREREALKSWIANPAELKPGSQMPAINLPPDDLVAVVDYLESLR